MVAKDDRAVQSTGKRMLRQAAIRTRCVSAIETENRRRGPANCALLTLLLTYEMSLRQPLYPAGCKTGGLVASGFHACDDD